MKNGADNSEKDRLDGVQGVATVISRADSSEELKKMMRK
jgi:hypothetical protein